MEIKTLNEEIARTTLNNMQRVFGGVIKAYGAGGVMLTWGPYSFFAIRKTQTGACEIVGDDFGAPIKLAEFKSLFQQQYFVQAVAKAMQRMGYQASQIALPNKSVIVRGTRVGGVYV